MADSCVFFFKPYNSYIQNMNEFRLYIEILIKIILTMLKEFSVHTKKHLLL